MIGWGLVFGVFTGVSSSNRRRSQTAGLGPVGQALNRLFDKGGLHMYIRYQPKHVFAACTNVTLGPVKMPQKRRPPAPPTVRGSDSPSGALS